MAGGVNLYSYAGNNPVTFTDPFGLKADTVEVACRPVEGLEGVAQHCAVRVHNEKVDKTFELRNVNGRNVIGTAPADQVAGYAGSWVVSAVPEGMTSQQYDNAVLSNASTIAVERNGERYSPFGGRNSNRYVYDVITRSGGQVPGEARREGRGVAPGLCGGLGVNTGGNCSVRH